MKKVIEVPSDVLLLKRNKDLRNKYTSPLIKWYQTSMTKEEKFKLGLMSFEEYNQWQAELAAEKAAEKFFEEQASEETSYHTFWEGDEGDRENISNDAYADFLAENNINVANSTALDIDSLLNESQ